VPRPADVPAASWLSATRDAVQAATDAIRAAGSDTPRLDAELLVADSLGVDRAELLVDPDLPLPPHASRLVMERVRRRTGREPVAYILGRKGFRGIELRVDARVLVPRPETELLVEVAAELTPRGGRVHEVGTGSGAVALALRAERPDVRVTASDASPGAVEVALENARRVGSDLEVLVAPGLPPEVAREAAAGHVALVVANLPYVREDEWAGLQPEITRYEPRSALVAGSDGLDAIRALVAGTPRGTGLALEHAPDQGEAVRSLLADAANTRRDLGGRDRVTVGRAP
jgi:release factor glutamine methyltransferase